MYGTEDDKYIRRSITEFFANHPELAKYGPELLYGMLGDAVAYGKSAVADAVVQLALGLTVAGYTEEE